MKNSRPWSEPPACNSTRWPRRVRRGTGVQAGGPDYLKQFMWSRMVSANTMRHGYVP